jgi:hypothetical protein
MVPQFHVVQVQHPYPNKNKLLFKKQKLTVFVGKYKSYEEKNFDSLQN